MRGTRIEILRDNLWRIIELRGTYSIRFNQVINRISNIENREIPHTNTFEIPPTQNNILALDINLFNPNALAISMNRRYPANYYIDDKLVQTGFLVINNTNEDVINANFLDEALDISDIWGSTSYFELIISSDFNRPSDYQTAIDEMKNYTMSQTTVIPSLSNVGSRGYKLAHFPNSLNTIGDEFQIDANGNRLSNRFNPYQSRPIFNAKALFDLSIETFGYTPVYSSSIDWDAFEKIAMVKQGLAEDGLGGSPFTKIERTSPGGNNYYLASGGIGTEFETLNAIIHKGGDESEYALKPSNISGWVDPPNFIGGQGGFFGGGLAYEDTNCVYVPDVENSFDGTIDWTGAIGVGSNAQTTFSLTFYGYAAWTPTVGSDVVFSTLTVTDNSSGTVLDVSVNKNQFLTPPAGADELIGIIMQYKLDIEITSAIPDPLYLTSFINSINIEETSLVSAVIAYDEYKQYVAIPNDLTYAAPEETIKELMKNLMQQQGMLIKIDSKNKEIKLFSYGHYEDQKNAGNFKNWSDYILKYRLPQWNTEYGNDYGKVNEISLSSPYSGNTFKYNLQNQGEDSKYKDYSQNQTGKFKDISSVKEIGYTIPYFEFKNTGLGLVEQDGTLPTSGTYTQQRADNSIQGNFSGLEHFVNINYANVPNGIVEWYKLVDKAVRVNAFFTLPVQEYKDFQIDEPVYIDYLGGFYIVEEIEEYRGRDIPVRVKLIKLIDNLKEE